MRTSINLLVPASDPSSTHKTSLLAPSPGEKKVMDHSQVFAVFDELVVSHEWKINPAHLKIMLDTLICAITQKKTPREAWSSLIKVGEHGESVGIKVATEPGALSGTHRELVEIIVKELRDAGVQSEKIMIWDRRRRDLEMAGYFQLTGVQLQWIEQGTGYDPKAPFFSPLIGQLVYGDLEFQESPHSFQDWIHHTQSQFSNESHYALLLSRHIDKIINIPSLCDSIYSGVHGGLASLSLGVIDNWRRFTKSPYFGDPAIGEIYASEIIAPKVILTLMDGIALEYAGGPGPNPSHTIPYGALFASYDPVAIDFTAAHLIDEQRCIAHLPKLAGKESHLQSAEAAGLGNAREEKIELISLRLQSLKGRM
jgi:uncharacterized protein (DUF362 family)